MTRLQTQDLVKRAAWTALQAFLATFLTLAPGLLTAPNLSEARALGVAAIIAAGGAALSALKGFVLNYTASR